MTKAQKVFRTILTVATILMLVDFVMPMSFKALYPLSIVVCSLWGGFLIVFLPMLATSLLYLKQQSKTKSVFTLLLYILAFLIHLFIIIMFIPSLRHAGPDAPYWSIYIFIFLASITILFAILNTVSEFKAIKNSFALKARRSLTIENLYRGDHLSEKERCILHKRPWIRDVRGDEQARKSLSTLKILLAVISALLVLDLLLPFSAYSSSNIHISIFTFSNTNKISVYSFIRYWVFLLGSMPPSYALLIVATICLFMPSEKRGGYPVTVCLYLTVCILNIYSILWIYTFDMFGKSSPTLLGFYLFAFYTIMLFICAILYCIVSAKNLKQKKAMLISADEYVRQIHALNRLLQSGAITQSAYDDLRKEIFDKLQI